jgi:phosphopantetheinyl transferase
MSIQMLNAPVEAKVCRLMIATMQQDLHKAEQDLLATLLPQERYFQAFARVNTLREAVARLEKVYVANFET